MIVRLLLVTAVATALHETGLLREGDDALLLIAGSSMVLAHVVGSLGLQRATRRSERAQSIGTSIAALACAFVPAWDAIRPGTPIAVGRLGTFADVIAVPPGKDLDMRILVSADLPEGQDVHATYALRGFRTAVEGALERTVKRVSAQRRLSVHRSSMFHRARLAAPPGSISLQAWNGVPASGLIVELFSERIPVWLNFVVASLVVIEAALLDRRLRLAGNMAAQAGAAVVLGLIISGTVTPGSVFAPAVATLVAGWCTGSLLGFAVARLVPRRLAS